MTLAAAPVSATGVLSASLDPADGAPDVDPRHAVNWQTHFDKEKTEPKEAAGDVVLSASMYTPVPIVPSLSAASSSAAASVPEPKRARQDTAPFHDEVAHTDLEELPKGIKVMIAGGPSGSGITSLGRVARRILFDNGVARENFMQKLKDVVMDNENGDISA